MSTTADGTAAGDGGSPGRAAPPLLAARGVRARYRRREVLRGVDLAIGHGEVVGISGENGSGKSTLLRVLAGMLKPDAGRVLRTATLGYAPQPPLIFEHLTVGEHFRYVGAARRLDDETVKRRTRELLDIFRFGPWGESRASELSEGTRQKLNLALALMADPEVLLLDEPYAGFEWQTYLRFWEHVGHLRERGRSVVVVSHLFPDRERLDRLLRLEDGRLEERYP